MFLRVHNLIDYSLLLVIESQEDKIKNSLKSFCNEEFLIDITDNFDKSEKKDKIKIFEKNKSFKEVQREKLEYFDKGLM